MDVGLRPKIETFQEHRGVGRGAGGTRERRGRVWEDGESGGKVAAREEEERVRLT